MKQTNKNIRQTPNTLEINKQNYGDEQSPKLETNKHTIPNWRKLTNTVETNKHSWDKQTNTVESNKLTNLKQAKTIYRTCKGKYQLII